MSFENTLLFLLILIGPRAVFSSLDIILNKGSWLENVPKTALEFPTLAVYKKSSITRRKTAVLDRIYVPENSVFIPEWESLRLVSQSSVKRVKKTSGSDYILITLSSDFWLR